MAVRRFLLALAAVQTLVGRATAGFDIGVDSQSDLDLSSFVTRPEIRAPLFNVTTYLPEAVSDGYWFVAPYVFINQDRQASRYYQPCQTGPAIYDNRGTLVWSGACMVRNQNTCDFRAWNFNGTYYMSAILNSYYANNDTKGHGIIMDSSYNTVQEVHTPTTINLFNMHELNLLDEGRRAMFIVFDPVRMELAELGQTDAGWVADAGFVETDLVHNSTIFEWWAHRDGHVSLAETQKPVQNVKGPYPKAFNWFHPNSIDKNAEGDYLFNSRYTDTMFKVSGKDGAIIWRLRGDGINSSFEQDFTFSRQHDARTIYIDEDVEIISFLDNASDEESFLSDHSSALVVQLDRHTFKAKVMNRIPRPDRGLSHLRGNHQVLPNGNHWICWSENSYLSEHTPDGQIAMEAKFTSDRFVTYRGYKFNFTGSPTQPPDVKAFIHGNSPEKAVTAIYASWNGATEVASWLFYRQDSAVDRPILLGEKAKTDFETVFYADFTDNVYVEALSKNGSVIGYSAVVDVVLPADFSRSTISDDRTLVNEPMLNHQSGRTRSLSEWSSMHVLFAVALLVMLSLISMYCCGGRRRSHRSPSPIKDYAWLRHKEQESCVI